MLIVFVGVGNRLKISSMFQHAILQIFSIFAGNQSMGQHSRRIFHYRPGLGDPTFVPATIAHVIDDTSNKKELE